MMIEFSHKNQDTLPVKQKINQSMKTGGNKLLIDLFIKSIFAIIVLYLIEDFIENLFKENP